MNCPVCKDTRFYDVGAWQGSEESSNTINGKAVFTGVLLHMRCCKGCGLLYALTRAQEKAEETEADPQLVCPLCGDPPHGDGACTVEQFVKRDQEAATEIDDG